MLQFKTIVIAILHIKLNFSYNTWEGCNIKVLQYFAVPSDLPLVGVHKLEYITVGTM